MPCIVRASNQPYRWEVGKAPLSEVANVEKFMPKEFITPDGYGITQPCKDYLIPLIQGEEYPPFENGMPKYVTLKNVGVPKKCGEFTLK
jgi:6-phosphofructokinase 1